MGQERLVGEIQKWQLAWDSFEKLYQLQASIDAAVMQELRVMEWPPSSPQPLLVLCPSLHQPHHNCLPPPPRPAHALSTRVGPGLELVGWLLAQLAPQQALQAHCCCHRIIES